MLLTGFAMDLLVLTVPKKLMRLKCGAGRMLLTAGGASIAGLAVTYACQSDAVISMCKIAISVVMAMTVAHRLPIRSKLCCLMLLWLSAFVAGGCALAFAGGFGATVRTVGVAMAVKPGFAFMPAISIALILVLTSALLLERVSEAHSIVDIAVENGGRRLLLRGFVDSGNSIADPLTGVAVILLDSDKFEILFPNQMTDPTEIPFRSAGGNGSVPAYRADRVAIAGREIDAFLAVFPGDMDGFDAILPATFKFIAR